MNSTAQHARSTPDVDDTGNQRRPDNGISTWRTRAIKVQAIRFDGTNHAAVQAFTDDRFEPVDPRDRGDDPDVVAAIFGDAHSVWLPVRLGDWVVQDEDSTFEVFSDTAFHAEFEAVCND